MFRKLMRKYPDLFFSMRAELIEMQASKDAEDNKDVADKTV